MVRVPMPILTEERRRDFDQGHQARGQNAKVAVRNSRRDAIMRSRNCLKARLCPKMENVARRRDPKAHRQTHRRYRKMIAAKKQS